MKILSRSGNGNRREPAPTGHENDASLQLLIAEHPSLIPGVSEQALACRKFSSGVGPADVVILDERTLMLPMVDAVATLQQLGDNR